jgi:formylglycine-generating enzyme required for sulfatase activity
MSSLLRSYVAWQLLTAGIFVGIAAGADEPKRAAGPSEAATPTWLPKPAVDVPASQAADSAAMKAYVEQLPGMEVKFKMVPIRGGTFLMGSPASEKGHKKDESPQHSVAVSSFWMEEHEATWDEYQLWGSGLDLDRRTRLNAAATPRDKLVDAIARPTRPYADMTFGMGRSGYPAICMTQLAAKMYCKWLSAKTGRYYRLPTEAEWEYACRGGTTTAYSFGDDPKKLGQYAWFTDNSDEKYHKVATKKPNPYGLYDMHGNVAEWVLDEYRADGYRVTPGTADNPVAVPSKEYDRVVRGGSWDDDAEGCRSAARTASNKEWKKQDPQFPQSIWYLTDANFVGFRVVRPLVPPTAEEARHYELDADQLRQLREFKASGKQ